ncbi:hypothetical protein BH11BAC7_BH11BAC7_09410 [soil metagenome]
MISMLASLNPKQVLEGKKNTFMAGNDVLWMNFDSTSNGIAHFSQFIDFIKRSWMIKDADFMNIKTVLSEAVLNAVDHGNKREEGKSVYVNARREGEHYAFTIEDEGAGFSPHRIENPTDKKNRDKPGGRGIFIMTYLSDDVQFSEGGTCVRLLFRGARFYQNF